MKMKKMKKKHSLAIKFGNWLIKYADPEFDKENVLSWNYNGVYYGTTELYKIFLKTVDKGYYEKAKI